MTGGILSIGLGLIAIANADALWQLALIYAALIAFGGGMADLPAATVVVHWFERRRATALGFMATTALLSHVVAFGTDAGFSASRAALLASLTASGGAPARGPDPRCVGLRSKRELSPGLLALRRSARDCRVPRARGPLG